MKTWPRGTTSRLPFGVNVNLNLSTFEVRILTLNLSLNKMQCANILSVFLFFSFHVFKYIDIFITEQLLNQQMTVNGTISVNLGRTKEVHGSYTKMESLHLRELV